MNARSEKIEVPACYSVAQIVKMTGVGRSTIYGAMGRGTLKARKLGRRTIVLASDLDNWLNRLPEVVSKQTD